MVSVRICCSLLGNAPNVSSVPLKPCTKTTRSRSVASACSLFVFMTVRVDGPASFDSLGKVESMIRTWRVVDYNSNDAVKVTVSGSGSVMHSVYYYTC